MYKNLLIVFFTLNLFYCFAQEEKYPIDQKLKQCLNAKDNHTTLGMLECAIAAEKEWDEQLNIIYKELMNVLSLDGQNQLIASQREWIKYRDKEFEFIEDYQLSLGGSIRSVTITLQRMSIIKQRTIELESHFKYLTFQQI
jgi:uncharacterized protein YecT (DUF1311 family)